jgi:hypothetical protein
LKPCLPLHTHLQLKVHLARLKITLANKRRVPGAGVVLRASKVYQSVKKISPAAFLKKSSSLCIKIRFYLRARRKGAIKMRKKLPDASEGVSGTLRHVKVAAM